MAMNLAQLYWKQFPALCALCGLCGSQLHGLILAAGPASIAFALLPDYNASPQADEAKVLIERIRWQGHGSFVLESQPRIQIAPWRVTKSEAKPDIILIGHDSFDHCSPADVEKIRGPATRVIGSQSAANIIPETQALRGWQSISIERATITAIPAAKNRQADPSKAALGFLVSLDLYDIYYVGEAPDIPQASHIKPDIILLPIDGYGRLTIDMGLALLERMQPRWAIPYNWGGSGGEATQLDAQSFRSRVTSATEVLLLEVNP